MTTREISAATLARSNMADELTKHFKSYVSEFKGDRSEYASGFRRAMKIAQQAAEGIASGKTFDAQDEAWK